MPTFVTLINIQKSKKEEKHEYQKTNECITRSIAADRQPVLSKCMCDYSQDIPDSFSPYRRRLKHVYYGNKLSETDLQNIDFAGTPNMPAYPVYGLNCPGESALAVKHADGNMTLQMEIVQTRTVKEGNAEVTVIEMKDKVYPFYVNVCYRTYQDADVIETWTEICHQEKKSVTLNQFASGFLPIRRGEVWLSHLYGSWANEAVYVRNCWNRE